MPRIKVVADKLKKGEIVAMPADTIYGLFGLAGKEKAVKKIATLKNRDEKKPFIILIAAWSHLRELGIKTDKKMEKTLRQIWPGPISVILPSQGKRFYYLRYKQNLAVRWPRNKFLTALIKKTGPLVSTSANQSGQPPATTAPAAKKIFDDQVGLYLSAKRQKEKKASTLIKLKNNKVEVIRLGQISIKKLRKKLNQYDFI